MEQFVRATLNNTVKLGAEVDNLKREINILKTEVSKIIANQHTINTNLLQILEKLNNQSK